MLPAMSKARRVYTCDACGAQHPKWQGQCPDCGAWNALTETRALGERARTAHYAGESELERLDRLDAAQVERIGSGLGELDRVLGGGLVPGSVVLIGGDPGIGKSTLLLSALAGSARGRPAWYVTGEESLDQIALRARRLGVQEAPIELLAETSVEAILGRLERGTPGVLVIDSIQTLFSEELTAAPGSVSQLRECAAKLWAMISAFPESARVYLRNGRYIHRPPTMNAGDRVTYPDLARSFELIARDAEAGWALAGAIDLERIGMTGHSLGGLTTMLVTYGVSRDDRPARMTFRA